MKNKLTILILAAIIFLSGCASQATLARRTAARMGDFGLTPLERLRAQEELIGMGPVAERYLADAFFPIGIYDVPEDYFDEVAAAGFNLLINPNMDMGDLSKAEAAGLRIIPYINLEKMEEEVARAQGHSAVMAWYLFDEPDLNKMPPETYRAHAERLRKLDPTRPIYLTLWSPKRYRDFVPVCDIFAPNPYPITHLLAEDNRLQIVGMALDIARQGAPGKAIWAIMQSFWAEPHWPRNPTPQELRAMVYLALNHGARGIIHFSWKSGDRPLIKHPALWAEIKKLNGEIRALKGALLVPPTWPPDIRRMREFTPHPLTQTGLDIAFRPYGRVWLLTIVNPHPTPKQLPLAHEYLVGKTLKPLFDTEAKPVMLEVGKEHALEFQGYEVKVFWVE
jgi:Beta-galactosidase